MLRALASSLLDLLIPPRQSERLVSNLTLEALHNLQTEEGLPYHDEAVRALVWEVKYYGHSRAAMLAGELLAEEIILRAGEEVGVPLLIPVPMHPVRRRARGHNQTEVLCEAAMKVLSGAVSSTTEGFFSSSSNAQKNPSVASLIYAPGVLRRVIDTPTQQGLERQKRLRNVKNSMEASASVAGRVCIVVDDVTTTGATLSEAKRALLAAGARTVYCIALAYS